MPAANGRILVWDAAVRVSHWLLAALVLFDWVRDDGDRVHRIAGYAAAAVVVLRIAWAFAGRGRGAIGELRPSLASTWAYLRAGAPRHLGHDPLGVWMIWWLWALVWLLAISGWISRLDAFWGDERVTDVHAVIADVLIVSVGVHLTGVLVMSRHWRENLVGAMISGRKPSGDDARGSGSPGPKG